MVVTWIDFIQCRQALGVVSPVLACQNAQTGKDQLLVSVILDIAWQYGAI